MQKSNDNRKSRGFKTSGMNLNGMKTASNQLCQLDIG